MNFIDYCINTRNYSSISTIKNYVKQFGMNAEDNKERNKIVGGSIAALGGAYLLGRSGGKDSASKDEELAMLQYFKDNPDATVSDYYNDHFTGED